MQMPTANLAQAASRGPLFGINTTNHGRLVVLGGGIPLVANDKVVGGIGVSGGTSAQDVEVANAAVQAFQSLTGAVVAAAMPNARIGFEPSFGETGKIGIDHGGTCGPDVVRPSRACSEGALAPFLLSRDAVRRCPALSGIQTGVIQCCAA